MDKNLEHEESVVSRTVIVTIWVQRRKVDHNRQPTVRDDLIPKLCAVWLWLTRANDWDPYVKPFSSPTGSLREDGGLTTISFGDMFPSTMTNELFPHYLMSNICGHDREQIIAEKSSYHFV